MNLIQFIKNIDQQLATMNESYIRAFSIALRPGNN